MSAAPVDPLDFSILETFTCRPALEGRLYLNHSAGHSAGQRCDRPALVFVHGGYMGAWAFTACLRHCDRLGIPAAAVDCRGHGGLPQGPAYLTASVADYARDVAAAAAHFAQPPVLVGHSLGALTVGVALGLCRVSGLGLLAPSPPGQLPGAQPVALVDEGRLHHPPARLSRLCGTDAPFSAASSAASARVRDRLCPESPVALNDRYGLRVNVARPRDVPAICIAAGRDDPERHPPGQDEAVGTFFGAENHRLPGAPHGFMLTPDWQDSATRLTDWYRGAFRHAA